MQSFLTATLGVFIIGSALENYLIGMGRMWPQSIYGGLLRTGLVIGVILSPKLVKLADGFRRKASVLPAFSNKDED
jgi:hypothetical protein